MHLITYDYSYKKFHKVTMMLLISGERVTQNTREKWVECSYDYGLGEMGKSFEDKRFSLYTLHILS